MKGILEYNVNVLHSCGNYDNFDSKIIIDLDSNHFHLFAFKDYSDNDGDYNVSFSAKSIEKLLNKARKKNYIIFNKNNVSIINYFPKNSDLSELIMTQLQKYVNVFNVILEKSKSLNADFEDAMDILHQEAVKKRDDWYEDNDEGMPNIISLEEEINEVYSFIKEMREHFPDKAGEFIFNEIMVSYLNFINIEKNIEKKLGKEIQNKLLFGLRKKNEIEWFYKADWGND